jgi:hypothetical protein
LVRQRLREIKRSAEELADAIEVPRHYVDDLISGSRRPPLPERTDIYAKMTSFLRLGRGEVVTRARAERGEDAARLNGPHATVRSLLLALCEAETARNLERRRARRGEIELAGFIQRLLEVAQGAVRRTLDDPIGLRLAAAERGSTYLDLRCRVLDFLDTRADDLTVADVDEYLRPRITSWNVDLETGVLRVVLRPQGQRDRPAKRLR